MSAKSRSALCLAGLGVAASLLCGSSAPTMTAAQMLPPPDYIPPSNLPPPEGLVRCWAEPIDTSDFEPAACPEGLNLTWVEAPAVDAVSAPGAVRARWRIELPTDVGSLHTTLQACRHSVASCEPYRKPEDYPDGVITRLADQAPIPAKGAPGVFANEYAAAFDPALPPADYTIAIIVRFGVYHISYLVRRSVLPVRAASEVLRAVCHLEALPLPPTVAPAEIPLGTIFLEKAVVGQPSGVRVNTSLASNFEEADSLSAHELGDLRIPSLSNGAGPKLSAAVPHPGPHQRAPVQVSLAAAERPLTREYRFLTLNGANSVVGRSLVVYRGTMPLSRCVVGIAAERESSPGSNLQVSSLSSPQPPTLACRLQGEVYGVVTFEPFWPHGDADTDQVGTSSHTTTLTRVHVALSAPVDAPPLRWRVLQWGDRDHMGTALDGLAGLATPNHEFPVLDPGSSSGVMATSFAYELNHQPLDGDDFPSELPLLLGRSLVLETSDSGELMAHCTLGRGTSEHQEPRPLPKPRGEGVTLVPQVALASCALEAPAQSDRSVAGHVHLKLLPSNDVEVSYSIAGLANLPTPYEWGLREYGDVASDDGASMGRAFVGGRDPTSNPCVEGCETIGAISSFPALYASGQILSGRFVAENLALNGDNSAIGRGIAITDGNRTVAQCVVGRASGGEFTSTLVKDAPVTRAASCRIRAAAAVNGTSRVTGVVRVDVVNTKLGSSAAEAPGLVTTEVVVSYVLSGLDPGRHAWHVHDYGDIEGTSGLDTNVVLGAQADFLGGHYAGRDVVRDPAACAANNVPESKCNELGQIDDGRGVYFTLDRFASGAVVDKHLVLGGRNSIIGRSIALHGQGSSAKAVLGHCVLGRAAPTRLNTLVPEVPADGTSSPTSDGAPSTPGDGNGPSAAPARAPTPFLGSGGRGGGSPETISGGEGVVIGIVCGIAVSLVGFGLVRRFRGVWVGGGVGHSDGDVGEGADEEELRQFASAGSAMRGELFDAGRSAASAGDSLEAAGVGARAGRGTASSRAVRFAESGMDMEVELVEQHGMYDEQDAPPVPEKPLELVYGDSFDAPPLPEKPLHYRTPSNGGTSKPAGELSVT